MCFYFWIHHQSKNGVAVHIQGIFQRVHGQSDRPGACSFALSYCVSASTTACMSVEDLLHFGDFGFYRWNCHSVSLDFFIGVTGECPDVQFSVGHLWLVTSPQFHFDRKWYCISTSAHHFAVFGTPRPDIVWTLELFALNQASVNLYRVTVTWRQVDTPSLASFGAASSDDEAVFWCTVVPNSGHKQDAWSKPQISILLQPILELEMKPQRDW